MREQREEFGAKRLLRRCSLFLVVWTLRITAKTIKEKNCLFAGFAVHMIFPLNLVLPLIARNASEY